MGYRMNKVSGIYGRRGTGKTTFIKELIAAYRQANPQQKVLIVDTLDHPAYKEIPALTLDQLKRWNKPSMYRIFGSNTEEILQTINDHLTNTLIIFEDASKYLGRTIDSSVRSFIYDSKQKNLDINFLFHGFMSCPPELFRMIDIMVLFKCDHPSRRKNDLTNYDEVLEAYTKVMEHESPYYNKTVQIF